MMNYNIAGLINQVNIDHKFIDVNAVCVEDLIINYFIATLCLGFGLWIFYA